MKHHIFLSLLRPKPRSLDFILSVRRYELSLPVWIPHRKVQCPSIILKKRSGDILGQALLGLLKIFQSNSVLLKDWNKLCIRWWQIFSFSSSSFFLPRKVHSRRREPSTILFIVQNQSRTTLEQSQTKSYSLARSTIQTTVTRVSTRPHIATSPSKKFSAKPLFHWLAILLRWET